MISLALTDKQILNTVPSSYWHRFDSAQHSAYIVLAFIISSIIIYNIIKAYLEFKHDMWIDISEGVGFLMLVVIVSGTVILSALTVVSLLDGIMTQPSDKTIALLSQAKVKVTKTSTVQLAGASSSGYSKTDVQGNIFYISGSSTGTSTFRYITKVNGMYQIKTLKDTYGDINPNDIFVNQTNKTTPSLVVETKEYANDKIAYLVDHETERSSKWTTYTFNVPENSITSSFSFK